MGNFGRHVPNEAEADPMNVRIRSTIDGTLDQLPDTFENWNPERVKEAALGFALADSNRIEQLANADAFLALHREFFDLDSNGQTMNKTLEALYGEKVYTVSEFEKAYEVCCANNSLTL